MTTHTGSCQCGAVCFEVDLEGLDGAMRCNCSRCRRTGIVMAFAPEDALRITRGEGATSVYRFNQHVIDHHFCPTCGIQPFGVGAGPDGTRMAAVNLRCIDGIDAEAMETPVYDGASA